MSSSKISDPESAMKYGAGILRGQRIQLRPLAEGDADSLAAWWQLGDWSVLQQRMIKPRNPAAVAEIFSQWSTNDAVESIGFSIEDEEGNLIGHTTFWGAGLPARSAVFAIILGPHFVDQGYGTDATRTMMRYGFEELGLHKIELHVWAFNTRAIRAYEKAGFITEGVRRAAAFHGGEFHDEVLMGILEAEYRELKQMPLAGEDEEASPHGG